MRRFKLKRLEDETGISGTGYIAEGVLFTKGTKWAVLNWLTQYTSAAIYPSIDELMKIHGHGGKTVLEWVDETEIE